MIWMYHIVDSNKLWPIDSFFCHSCDYEVLFACAPYENCKQSFVSENPIQICSIEIPNQSGNTDPSHMYVFYMMDPSQFMLVSMYMHFCSLFWGKARNDIQFTGSIFVKNTCLPVSPENNHNLQIAALSSKTGKVIVDDISKLMFSYTLQHGHSHALKQSVLQECGVYTPCVGIYLVLWYLSTPNVENHVLLTPICTVQCFERYFKPFRFNDWIQGRWAYEACYPKLPCYTSYRARSSRLLYQSLNDKTGKVNIRFCDMMLQNLHINSRFSNIVAFLQN